MSATVPGTIHADAAMLALIAFPAGALLLSKGIGQFSPSRKLKSLLAILAPLSALALAIFFACLAPVFSHRAPHAVGLAERALLAVYLAWLATAAIVVCSSTSRCSGKQTVK